MGGGSCCAWREQLTDREVYILEKEWGNVGISFFFFFPPVLVLVTSRAGGILSTIRLTIAYNSDSVLLLPGTRASQFTPGVPLRSWPQRHACFLESSRDT